VSFLSHLECGMCGRRADADAPAGTCPDDGRPLLARYDIDAARRSVERDQLARRPATMWRYAEMLPVRAPDNVVSLGEGFTPLIPLARLAAQLGVAADGLTAKDEGRNPTGSFKARGMSAAVSRAAELGARTLVAPSAGNAGAALAAYGARAGLEVIVAMPADAPASAMAQVERLGARLLLVDGLISDAGAILRQLAPRHGWWDMSTLREPYRVEGKKTLGYELAEQLGWELPDVIVYPTGGGTGLVGMWKAFAEMEALGWIDGRRPRMVSVQAAGCAPIVDAWQRGDRVARPWPDAATIAAGLRVPGAIGDFLILDAIRQSGGAALAVTDDEMAAAVGDIAAAEGLLVSLEAAATLAGYRRAIEQRLIDAQERAVLFFTGSGLLDELTAARSRPVVAPMDIDGAERALNWTA
jgi:threonine synthase